MTGTGEPAHLAFVCAMPMELRPLVRKLGLRRVAAGDVELRSGRLGSRSVVAIATGMGTERARNATRRLLDAVVVDRVVVFGITGAVENETPIGTLIRPEAVVDSASGAEYVPVPLGDAAPRGKMWTTDELTTDLAVVADLRARGVVSLDMETAAIAAVSEERGIPWSVVRSISDRATDGSVDPEVFALSKPDGTPDPGAVLRYFVRHPRRVPGLVRLAQGSRRATLAAASAAVADAAGA